MVDMVGAVMKNIGAPMTLKNWPFGAFGRPPAMTIWSFVGCLRLEIVEMFEILSGLSEDRTEASVQLPSMAGPQKMSADELSELIRHLTQLRADMSPARENDDPTPKIQTVGAPDPEPPASAP